MKRNLSGDDAYMRMITAQVPEKTDTYTPIPHSSVYIHLREEIVSAKFIIVGEDFSCTADSPTSEAGQVGMGLLRIKFKPDPDLVLVATFMNSYNKQFAFRFALGAQVSVAGSFSGNTIMLEDDIHGFYKRVHTGEADVLAEGVMRDLIANAEDHWNKLVEFKNKLMSISLSYEQQHHILGQLFFRQDLLTTYQLNLIKKELQLFEAGLTLVPGKTMDAWMFYNCVALGIKGTHPAEWMDVHSRVHRTFSNLLELEPAPTTPVIPITAAASLPGASGNAAVIDDEDDSVSDEERQAADDDPDTDEPLDDDDDSQDPNVAAAFGNGVLLQLGVVGSGGTGLPGSSAEAA